MQSPNPLTPFLENQGTLILDGGLATALEAKGFDLNDPLWSARLLIEQPEAIRDVHLDFLEAGADCISTASYQASIAGFAARGLSGRRASELLQLSVRLACEARGQFWESCSDPSRHYPLVAASVGPYGAFLADGSEYTGDYDLDEDGLYSFHEDRWRILAASGADLMACETIPTRAEAAALLRLLDESAATWAWLSFCCRDGTRLSEGSLLADSTRDCDSHERVAAVGINCTAPQWISSLVREARRATARPVIVYPNSGELFDAVQKRWLGEGAVKEWGDAAKRWRSDGAAGVGGCCRVDATMIHRIRSSLDTVIDDK